MASMQSSVSSVASIPIVKPSFKSPLDVKSFVKSGNEMFAKTSDGILTNCVGLSESSEDRLSNAVFVRIPITTMTSGAGSILSLLAKGR